MGSRATIMGTGRPDPDSCEAVLRRAAHWRVRVDAGLTPAEEHAFSDWLAADERHAAAFAELDDTWTLLDRAQEVPAGTFGVPATPAPPAANRRRRVRPFVGWLSLAAAAALLLAVSWPRIRPPADASHQIVKAGPGSVRRIDLPDGSRIRLNAESELAIRYRAEERRVVLVRGQGYFEVAKDPARPFVVGARGVDVRVVGTAFSVADRGGAVEVLVAEGQVRVQGSASGQSLLQPPAGEPRLASSDRILVAGEKAVIPLPSASAPGLATISAVPPQALSAALAWQKRLLEFDAAPLATIVAEFNRHNAHQILVADERLAAQRFSGSFQADEPETLVRLLETRSDIVVERRSGETVLRRRDP